MCSLCERTISQIFFSAAVFSSSRPSSPRRRCCCSPHRARVRPRAGARDRRADALVADRVRARSCCTISTGAGLCIVWRMASILHMAKLLVRNALFVVAVVRPRGAPPCLQRSTVHGQHRTSLCQGLHVVLCCFDTASCCTIGMCVTAVDACCSDRVATTGVLPAGLCASGAGASRAASALPTGPTCRGGPAGRCLRASTSSSSRGARDASNPAAHGARARSDCVLCACARAGTRPRLRRRPRRRRLSSAHRESALRPARPGPPPQPRRRSPQQPPRFGPAPLAELW